MPVSLAKPNPADSSITHSKGGTMFAGPAAVDVFRAITLKSALGMTKHGLVATRGMTKTRCLAMVTEYTGKKYKRTEVDQALADLQTVIDAARAAIPEKTVN